MIPFVEKKFQNLHVQVNSMGSVFITVGTQVINLEFTQNSMLVETWDPNNLDLKMNKTLEITDELKAVVHTFKPENQLF